MERVTDAEYLFIRCEACEEHVKLAKNKGASWAQFEWLEDFLAEHAGCHQVSIRIFFDGEEDT